jgi:glutaredoxin
MPPAAPAALPPAIPGPALRGGHRRRAAALLAAGALVGLTTGPADAQQRLYRIVEPDGRITFTDRPPPTSAGTRAATPIVSTTPPTGGLPADLAAIVGRFPVMLLTGPDCAPCADGRALLRSRGVPYTERLVTTPRDQAELKRLSGGASLPALLVGRQPVSGLNASDWQAWLDAAGYPTRSQLPAGWRAPAPAPLAPPQAESASTTPAAAAPLPATQPGPGGIRF